MAKTAQEISQSIRTRLKLTDPDLSLEPVTTERKITDAFAEELAEAYADNAILSYQFDVDTKVGEDLDRFVALFGFGRVGGRRATGMVTFSRSSPAPDDILIEAGVQVLRPATSITAPVTFFTTSTAVMFAGTTSVEVPIEAIDVGIQGNVPAGTITTLSLGVGDISEVINENATTGGVAPETDAELKVRFKNTIFRNIAGTPDQYLALAIASRFSSKANVIGPMSRFFEYLQIESDLEIASQIPYSKYTYDFDYFLTDGEIVDETFFTKGGVDYTFDDSVPPIIIVNNLTNLPVGSVVLLEHAYCSKNSRNDPANNVANYVDIFVSGQDSQNAIESTQFAPGLSTVLTRNLSGGATTVYIGSAFGLMESGSIEIDGGQVISYASHINNLSKINADFTLPVGTITAGNTTAFDASGDLFVNNNILHYTGKSNATGTLFGPHEFPAQVVYVTDAAALQSIGGIEVTNTQVGYTSKASASTTTSGSHTLPQATITVASTTGFATSGRINVDGQIVEYTGTTGTTFIGCTGGTGVIANGSAVSQHRLVGAYGGSGTAPHGAAYTQGVFTGVTGGSGTQRQGSHLSQGKLTGVTGLANPVTEGGYAYVGQVFTSELSTSRFYTESYVRIEDGSIPQAGNHFQQVLWQPLSVLPETIIVNGVNYVQGTHFWLVKDISPYKGSKRARDGIEWSSTIAHAIREVQEDNFMIGEMHAFEVPLVLSYTFNKLPLTINELMDVHKQVTADVLVHEATNRYFNINLVVMYKAGALPVVVDNMIEDALIDFFSRLPFGSIIQLSDIVDVVHDVEGVDNCRLALPGDGVDYGVQEVGADGATPIGSPFLNDFIIEDSDLAVLNSVGITQRSQNTWLTTP